jgi:hypothetical protein
MPGNGMLKSVGSEGGADKSAFSAVTVLFHNIGR